MSLNASLKEMLDAWGVDVEIEAQTKMILLLRELLRWNRAINLTAIRDEREVLEKHIVDSLCLIPFLDGSERILDIGSGGGFPSMPLKLAMPTLSVTSIDAAGKKVHFQRHAARLLGLDGFETIHGRVEDLSHAEGRHGSYDVVVSRAFASLADFCQHAYPFLNKSGRILAMKGAQGEEEMKEGGEIIERLGLERVRVEKRTLPLSGGRRVVIELRKKG